MMLSPRPSWPCPSEAAYEVWADGKLLFLPLGIDIDRKSDPANPHIYILGCVAAVLPAGDKHRGLW